MKATLALNELKRSWNLRDSKQNDWNIIQSFIVVGVSEG